MRVKLLLEGNDNTLQVGVRLLTNVIGHLTETSTLNIIPIQYLATSESPPTLLMFVLSSAASISSRTKKGDGWKLKHTQIPSLNHTHPHSNTTPTHTQAITHLWIAKRRARAATVFSPPDKLSIGRNLPIENMLIEKEHHTRW